MSVNSVNNVNSAAYTTPVQTTSTKAAENAETSKKAADKGVVYEKSNASKTSTKNSIYSKDDIVARMKRDTEARTAQLRSLVEKMMAGQANAYGKANDIWSFLRSGNYTVDPATKAQAQADIAEDGYWGVNQTSDRIIDFAKALTGGDPDKIEDMRAAFEKGFKKAGKTWGGDLPDISQRTYKAVMEKFDQMAEEAKKTSSTPVDTEA